MKFKKSNFEEYYYNALYGLDIPEIMLNILSCHSFSRMNSIFQYLCAEAICFTTTTQRVLL